MPLTAEKQFVNIGDLLAGKYDGQTVGIRGWLHNVRSSGGIVFLQVRDGSGIVQCTVRKGNVPDSVFDEFAKARLESAVRLEGTVNADPRAPGGKELKVRSGEVPYPAIEEFPIAKKFHGPEFLLDNRHLYIRNEKMQAVLKIRATFLAAVHEWFDRQGFTEVQVPTLITAAVEGGSTLFEVKYFEEKAYLSQSWQLYAEAMISSVGSIYTVAPSFRAEKSRTRRHLTEYWHIEAEEPWSGLERIMRVEEELLSHVIDRLRKERSAEIRLFGRADEDLVKVKPPFPRITYDEAVQKIGGEAAGVCWGDDLGYEQEKLLTVHFDRPFFVTHYPKRAKAFYHKPDPKNPEVTLSADMLAPEGYGEITGGGERIADYETLMARIKQEGMDAKSYQWYLDIRKFGSVPHAGFGMGLERTVAWICKLEHIRDAIAFPRLINRIYP